MALFQKIIKHTTGVDLEKIIPIPKPIDPNKPLIDLTPRSIKVKQRAAQREKQKKTEEILNDWVSGSGDMLHKLNQKNNQKEDAETKANDNFNNVLRSIPIAISEHFVDNKTPNIGDHLLVSRTGYTHHGIYIGGEEVIHYLLDCVTRSSLSEFANGSKIRILRDFDSPASYAPDEIVSRAKSRLYEDSYSVFSNNCEHFARWCRCNEFDSES
ncbi:lecithin retinol acyltransferase family protein [Chakrabartyella piscis]|uniref:lecithin retinol acyltransferase family protein n=1 Tax=Chakrabartyella piscis TaxID=2918914 RepID=UPI0029583F5F|nr:lecithin retinol acyltransferase family protein [Chakrabartyella piscis]